jgi:hypothetical protein
LSVLVSKWSNPQGGEEIEFVSDGSLVVRRAGEVLTSQRWTAQDNGTGAGRLLLSSTDGGEVALGYCVSSDILAMSYGGETTIYVRAV